MSMEPARYVSDILLVDSSNNTSLLQHLIHLQGHYRHIPADAISALASALDLPETEIRGVIEFYSFLHLVPRGKYDILFSDSITDQMLGSRQLLEFASKRLKISIGQVRKDQRVSLDTTSCTGICDQGPALLVNGIAIANLDETRINQISQLIESDVVLDDWPDELFAIEDNIQREDILLASLNTCGDYRDRLSQLISKSPEDILDTLQASGLRGRGGAGYPTANKWRYCREASADQRFVICNADEGEPGTFKDRVLLNRYAHQLIEGMTLCAHTINASRGYIYLRGEYLYLQPQLQAVLDERRNQGLLGKRTGGTSESDFDIEIHLGAGAYICGEESALIDSLEGKRGIPRKRPPFPVTHGYLGQPTVVNNVETFIAASEIMLNGADWFTHEGTTKSSGTKLLSISGDCDRPGIYEYPFGTPIQRILRDCGAEDVQAVQIAGAAGESIAPDQFDRTIAFEDVGTGGSFIVFNQKRDLLNMVSNFANFFVHESCGFCTPCRVGGALLRDLVAKVHAGHGSCYDLDEMRGIAQIMKETSFCGLGATAPNHVINTLNRFPEIYEQKLSQVDFQPAFDLEASLEQAKRLAHRNTQPGVCK